MQAAVVVHKHDVQVPGLVGGTAKRVLDPLRLLVFVTLEAHQSDVFRAEQYGLAAVKGFSVVGCVGVHVALCQVIQLPDANIGQHVALLHCGFARDAELLYERQMSVVALRQKKAK